MKLMKKELARIDYLIERFTYFHSQYPNAGFLKTVHELQSERAKVTSSIGKEKKYD